MSNQIKKVIFTEEIKQQAIEFLNSIENSEIPFVFPIIGDFIVDRYRYCKVERKNLEHDSLIHDLIDSSHYYGGAANVANIIGTFMSHTKNSKTLFLSGCGKDDRSYISRIQLDEPQTFNISLHTDLNYHRVIPVKARYISQNRNEYLFRIDSEPTKQEFPAFSNQIDKLISSGVKSINTNSVFISDYNKGFISDFLIENISNINHITRWYCNIRPRKISKYLGHMHLLSFNKTEFIQAYEILFDILLDVISIDDIIKFKTEVNIPNLIITFGSNGMIFCGNDCCKKIDSFKNLSVGSKNIIGAGDMVSAAFAFFDTMNYNFFLEKYSEDVILYLVNCAAFLKVYTGEYTVSFDLMKSYINGKLCLF